MAALDMMLHFVSEASTPDIAVAVAEQFIHPQIRQQEDNQRIELHTRYSIDSPKLMEIIRLMEGAIEKPLDISHISDQVGLSARQVERLFREQLGAAPKSFYWKLRLAWARALLRQIISPLSAIAFECGFGSTSHFCHAYKRVYDIAPSVERQLRTRHGDFIHAPLAPPSDSSCEPNLARDMSNKERAMTISHSRRLLAR